MNASVPPQVNPTVPPTQPKFNLHITAVRFDEESFVFSLYNETELLLRVPVELLLDILASAPESVHPHILKGLADAQVCYQQTVQRLLTAHPERVTTTSMLIPEGENWRRVFYRTVRRDQLQVPSAPQRTISMSHKGALYRVVRVLAEGEALPAPDRVMVHPDTWVYYLLEEIPEVEHCPSQRG